MKGSSKMIRNIVFDFGNVLVNFHPEEYVRPLVNSDEEAKALSDLVFLHPIWKDGDLGRKNREEIIRGMGEIYPEKAELIRQVIAPSNEMLTMPDDIPLFLHELQEKGYHLYYISNTNDSAYTWMRAHYPIMTELEGGIASFQEGILKPSREIFQLLLNRYNLKAEECLFVDDMPENTRGAEEVGYQSLTLPGADHLRRCLTDRLGL